MRDLALREREIERQIAIAGRGASVIQESVREAGLGNVEFIEMGVMCSLFDPVHGPGIAIGNKIGQVHLWRHIERSRLKRHSERTAGTLTRATLETGKIDAEVIIIDVPGYDVSVYNIPPQDLLSYFFSNDAREASLRYYLNGPNEFPFHLYRNWAPFQTTATD